MLNVRPHEPHVGRKREAKAAEPGNAYSCCFPVGGIVLGHLAGWCLVGSKAQSCACASPMEINGTGVPRWIVVTNEQINSEINELQAVPPGSADFRWAQDHVLLMTNGECIIYVYRHGDNSGFVDHLFLGHGSNGRWLYSTYHFCNSMVGVLGEDPPGSIGEFAKRFSVREFDGRSDECLQHTWPQNN